MEGPGETWNVWVIPKGLRHTGHAWLVVPYLKSNKMTPKDRNKTPRKGPTNFLLLPLSDTKTTWRLRSSF